MLVAVHINQENPAEVLGVWGPPDESELLSCCYADAAAEAAGRSGMESWPPIRPGFGWERWVDHLAGRVPCVIWWAGYEMADGAPLEVALVEASAAFLASAAALHGTSDCGFTAVMMDKETELQLAGDWAGLVAYRHGGPVEAFVSSHRLSSRFSFRADEATLLVALAKTLKKVTPTRRSRTASPTPVTVTCGWCCPRSPWGRRGSGWRSSRRRCGCSRSVRVGRPRSCRWPPARC